MSSTTQAQSTQGAAGKSLFFLGVTGYIGSSVLDALLPRLASAGITSVTCLTRKEDKVSKIESYQAKGVEGVTIKAIKGSLGDLELLEKQAKEADVVVNTADADDLEATRALLRGMSSRKASTGHRPIYLHTSGTGVLADTSAGAYPTQKIYTDLGKNMDAKPPLLAVDSLPSTALHRNVDLAILEADANADIRAYIILPSTIYGINRCGLVAAGVGNDQSLQMPALIKASIDRGRPGMVGKGQNIWPNVHIDDVGQLFRVVFDYAVTPGKKGNHGHEGYYFAESGEHTLWSVGQRIGLAMYRQGLAQDTEPTTFSKEELDKYFNGSDYLGSNSRCRGDRSRKLGWKPKHDASDFLDSLDEEVRVTNGKKGEQGFDFGGKI